ncbi:MAG: glycosyltransferase family 4 protein [Magnetospirillum sp.]|nr:glycosyltransferase family 4 protein [Magnetospirillum sp.]
MTHLWTRLVTPFLRASRRRLICTVHDATLHPGEFSHLKDWFYAPVPRVDHYITLTNFVADRLEQIHAISRDRMDVIPHGVNAQFAPVPPVPRRPGEPLRLLFFGRLLPYKGLDRLLRAYKQLVGQGHPLTLTIAGSGELEDDTAQLIARLPGVTLHQRWISEEDIPGFLADADCVVLPYVEASQSGVVPAAFAAGVTAIVTPVGGLPEQVSHDHDGLVTESTSPSALAAAILRLLEDPHLLPRLRAGASQSAVNDFSWAKIAENLAEIALASLNRKP